MSLKKSLNSTLKNQIGAYAAWLPGVNSFNVGDYGIISDGIFNSLGNIAQPPFNVDFSTNTGSTAKLNFTSEGVRVIAFQAGAEIPVSQLPDSDIEAELKFKFEKENSLLLKADPISVVEMSDEFNVAQKLGKNPLWKNKRWKVVRGVYSANGMTFLGAQSKGTEFSIKGKASALKKLLDGNVNASFSITKTKDTQLSLVGEDGNIGLQLFRINKRSQPSALEAAGGAEVYQIEKDFGPDLEDDGPE